MAVLDWSHPRVGAVRLVALAQSGIRSMSGAALNDEQFRDGKPTLEYARTLPKTFATMTNKQVLHFAELSVPEACRECVVRDIMSVDQVEYDEVRFDARLLGVNKRPFGCFSLHTHNVVEMPSK